MAKVLQLTLIILKPHVVSHPFALKSIKNLIKSAQFLTVSSKQLHMTRYDAQQFYSEHENKFFYNRLVTSMCSGPCEAAILARENAILHWRNLMGPTKVFQTQFLHPETIRGTFGLSDTRNATHGSDSVESARKEINLFFPEFNIDKWYEEEEVRYRTGSVKDVHFGV